MKNWKIVWTIITGSIFTHSFNTFEEMENWLAARAEQLEPFIEKLTVFELYNNEYKIRYTYKKA